MAMTEAFEIHTLAGAYALDALTELERAGFARHVAVCPACATEVAELTETAARLGAVTALTPPPGLRTRVLAEIAKTRQATDRGPVRHAPGNAVQRWRRWTAAAAAAAVVAVGGVGAMWAVEENRLGDVRRQAAADQTEISQVLNAQDVQLRTVAVNGGGRITVAVSPSHNEGVVAMSDMPAPPSDKAYQLWLIRGRTPTPAGIMAAGASGGTALVHSISGADQLGVTLELAGGAQLPSMAPIVGVKLA
jgi:anti-sigma-K factor RskA